MLGVRKLSGMCILCTKNVIPIKKVKNLQALSSDIPVRFLANHVSNQRRHAQWKKKSLNVEVTKKQKLNVKPLIADLLCDDETGNDSKHADIVRDMDRRIKDLERLLSATEDITATNHQMTEERISTESHSQNDELHNPESPAEYVEELALDVPQKWDTFQGTSLPEQTHEYFGGSPDDLVLPSDVPCPGCGAKLQCQKPNFPGYIPAEKYKEIPPSKLRDHFCRRCNLMRHYDLALNTSVKPEEYIKIISQIKDVYAVTLLVVDLTDLPNSLFHGLSTLIGRRRPLYILGNKVDLLPYDGPGYLTQIKKTLEDVCKQEGLFESMYIHHVGLISAKTGYGIEELITKLFSDWSRRGHVYVLGCTNVGKSTLFNSLLMSDYCKAGAREYIHRATTSFWPGTTLSLLQFPITPADSSMIYNRVQRLIADRKENAQAQASTGGFPKKKQKLKDKIGRTFLSPREKRVQASNSIIHGYDTATYSFDRSSGAVTETAKSKKGVRREMTGEREDYDEDRHEQSKWCYDTPGVINPQQIINLLTQEEMSVVIHKSCIRPRFFVMKLSQVMFVSGLSRLDYVEGPVSVQVAVFTASGIPVHVRDADDADGFYRENLGTPALGVPLGDNARIESVPALVGRKFELTGCGRQESCADITLSSLGWVAVTGNYGAKIQFRVYTPGGVGCVLREPGLLRNAIRHRGKRIKGTASYEGRS